MIWKCTQSSKASCLDTSSSPERDLAACLLKIPADPNCLLSISVFRWMAKKSPLGEAASTTHLLSCLSRAPPPLHKGENTHSWSWKWNEFLKYQEAESISKALPSALLAAKWISEAKMHWLYFFKGCLICQNTFEYSRTVMGCQLSPNLSFLPSPPWQKLTMLAWDEEQHLSLYKSRTLLDATWTPCSII